jgi:uncharacterized protein (DUF1800 family)
MPFPIDRRRRAAARGASNVLLCIAGVAAISCASRSQSLEAGVDASAHHEGPAPLAPVSDSGRDLTADQQVLQALNRLTFGPRPGEIARVRQMGVDRWIALQLSPDRIADARTDSLLARFPAYNESIAALELEYPPGRQLLAARLGTGRPNGPGAAPLTHDDSVTLQNAERAANRLVLDVQTLKVARALSSERELQEVMVDFWENHFTVYDRKGQQMRYYLAEYDRDAIRPYALGHFRDLLEAVAKSPAMLFYLDNWESVADSTEPTLEPRPMRAAFARPRPQQPGGVPATQQGATGGATPASPIASPPPRRPARGLNENYGRELLELHTLGVDGGYTQQDVINVARALTGWSIERPRENRQDRQDQSDSSGFVFHPQLHDAGPKVVLGHPLAEGRGIEDGEEVLDMLARSPSTAHFIATKLCRRFVSDSPPPALVERAAATFTRTDGDIRKVLWTILTSPEFFSRAAYRTKVKSPFELVVSALRAMNAEPDTTQRTAQLIARMGEPIFGHQAPNGYPETGESWMNTGAILNRINFGLAVAANRVPGATLNHWPGAAALAAAPRAVQVDTVVNDILGGSVSPDTRAILMSGDHPLLSALTRDQAASDAASQANGRSAAPDGGDPRGDVMTAMASGGGDMVAAKRRPPGPGGAAAPPLQGLAQVLGLALGAPEFQRR